MKNPEQPDAQELNWDELKEIQGGIWWLVPLLIASVIIKNC
ncbi:hypothetical protein [Dyadobacter flavalbus]|nr:hypothetical protein [Dyadobacter flavalbus]